MNQFDNIADTYDKWKIQSPFFSEYERLNILKIVENYFIKYVEINYSILDIGTGTGIWIEEVKGFIKSSFSKELSIGIGIDNSSEMIAVCKNKNIPNCIFVNRDLSLNSDEILKDVKFDIIIGGLCIDYIGVKPVIEVIKNNLNNGGIGIIWFYNPDRYKGKGKVIRKKWNVCGKNVDIISNRIDINQIYKIAQNSGIIVETKIINLPVISNINRDLIILTLKLNT